MSPSFFFFLLWIVTCSFQKTDSSYHDQSQAHRNSSKPLGKFTSDSQHKFLKIKGEPVKEKTPSRKQLKFQEASSSSIQTKLKDILGRVPWNYHTGSFAPYADGGGGLSQERLQAIMNQLTNDIRVNGRRVTPLQAQIVQQSSNGDLNPATPDLKDMQNDMLSQLQDAMQPNMQDNMQDDMQSNKLNGMQNDDGGDGEIKPIQVPWNQKGGSNAQFASPSTFERLMFGGLSQIAAGGQNKGYPDFGGGVSNVPGLSFGDRHTTGVINLMESENGLKPMAGMNGMRGMNGMHGMTMNGMGGMHRMGGRMWGGGSFFSRRGETFSHKNIEHSKGRNADNAFRAHKTRKHAAANNVHQVQKSYHEAKPSAVRLIPSEMLLPETKKLNILTRKL